MVPLQTMLMLVLIVRKYTCKGIYIIKYYELKFKWWLLQEYSRLHLIVLKDIYPKILFVRSVHNINCGGLSTADQSHIKLVIAMEV